MMYVLRPTYTLTVTLKKPLDPQMHTATSQLPNPWDGLAVGQCDKIVDKVNQILRASGFTDFSVRLTRFEET